MYSFPMHENIPLTPAEIFAYLLNLADPHAGWLAYQRYGCTHCPMVPMALLVVSVDIHS